MVPHPDEIVLSISDRIIAAFDKEFAESFPNLEAGDKLKTMIKHHISLSADIARSNTVEQIIEFIKTAQSIDGDLTIPVLLRYLKTNDFNYKPIKHATD